MIIKNPSLTDKVIEQLMHDHEDQKPLQMYLQKIEQLNQHTQLLIPNIKLVQFFNVGQIIECTKQVYILLKGRVNSDETILKHDFVVLRPSVLLSFNRSLINKIEQLNHQRQIEHKLTFLIQYTFFSGLYLSQLRAVIEQIPLVTYNYNTNLSRILPGQVCIIKAGSVVLQSRQGVFPKQFSIITEKDYFGEVHFIDEEYKINLKSLTNQVKYEAICYSQTVELYLLNVNHLPLNFQQLKICLAKKYKERTTQLRQTLSSNYSPPSQPRLRIKTLNSDSQYEHMRQREEVAIEKVKQVVKNMNFSYSRTRNYFASKLGAGNMMFHKAFMYKFTPTYPVKKRQPSLSSAAQLTQRNTRTRCQTVSNFELSSRMHSENKVEKIN